MKLTRLLLEVWGEGGDDDPVYEITPGCGQQVQRLNDCFHRGRGLRVRKLQARDAEEDLSACQDDVLGKEPHHVQGVGLGSLLNVKDEVLKSSGLQKASWILLYLADGGDPS